MFGHSVLTSLTFNCDPNSDLKNRIFLFSFLLSFSTLQRIASRFYNQDLPLRLIKILSTYQQLHPIISHSNSLLLHRILPLSSLPTLSSSNSIFFTYFTFFSLQISIKDKISEDEVYQEYQERIEVLCRFGQAQ